MFEKVKKNFGFGCMRLPMVGEQVDHAHFCKMVDHFLEMGFNYFDTAHGYLGGKSETALKACLTSRYPRESYVLTNKLSGGCFETEADIRPLFEAQLEACGVEYFDFYLMHAQSRNNYDKFKACRGYEIAMELKAEGKIRHLGISFHDSAEFLDKILTEYPQIEVVQIQFNYADMENPNVQSRACHQVCRKHGKPVIVMEPVKGGRLVNLPVAARQILEELGGGSVASYAVRFAAGFEGMMMVLSGMGDLDMVKDNCGYMADFKPLNEQEQAAVSKVAAILADKDLIACTGCRYCVDGCPASIDIPAWFAAANDRKLYGREVAVRGADPASCLQCGQCENVCPQKLPIRDLLEKL